ncbi:MAG: sel1 repeat family protein [Proteobacteria bacterium]|nr:sel1 repeat family protein [Pseudomonadota bacterium]NOG61094.1 sel1 repeat family protein [Pseudomonadota bacterium]
MRVFIFDVVFIFLLTSCAENSDPKILFDKGEYDKSLPLWVELATKGDALAQNYVGIQYYLGLGTERNYQQAIEWFEKSATQGFADAQYNLAVMYENGQHVQQDYTIAAMWYSLAIDKENEHARRRMQGLLDEHKLFPNQYNRAKELAQQYR